MKQLYDVDKLFNEAENVEEIKQSFIHIANRELGYRKLNEFTYEEVLDDIEDFAEDIIYREDKSNLQKINVGLRKFTNFMLERKFLIDQEVLTCASKVAYLVSILRSNEQTLEKYEGQKILGVEIPKEYKRRLKVIQKTNEEAYYYIVKSLDLDS